MKLSTDLISLTRAKGRHAQMRAALAAVGTEACFSEPLAPSGKTVGSSICFAPAILHFANEVTSIRARNANGSLHRRQKNLRGIAARRAMPLHLIRLVSGTADM